MAAKHHTKPSAARNRTSSKFTSCQAVGTHEIMRGLLQAYTEVELTCDTESEPVKDILRELFDARDAYDHILTFTRATSVEGAMAQLSVLHDRVEMMFQGITNPGNQGDLAPIRRTIERLLYSIAGVLRTVVGDEMADHVFENDFHPRYDPLPKIERGSIGASVADTIDDCLKKAEASA